MRRLFERTLGPVVERVFDALEQRVTAEHLHQAAERALESVAGGIEASSVEVAVFGALAAEARAGIAGESVAASSGELADCARTALEAAEDWGVAFESGAAARKVHWIGLLPDLPLNATPPWLPDLELDPGPTKSAPDPRRLAVLDAALALGSSVDAIDTALQAHTACLAPREWFLLKGTHYGISHLLRALLRVLRASPGHALEAYGREVCDRLIRHVEIRRQQALVFRAETLPAGADPLVERCRFALSLVEATVTFRDLRYLNTALKLNEWQLRKIRSRASTSSACLHYAVAIGRQERAMREVLGE